MDEIMTLYSQTLRTLATRFPAVVWWYNQNKCAPAMLEHPGAWLKSTKEIQAMKSIPLTKGQFSLVDDEDFEWLNRYKWQAKWDKNTKSFYAVRSTTIGGKNGKKVMFRMHREIMHTPQGLECDHKNHNTLDNRKRNLRNVTHAQNSLNKNRANTNNKMGEKNIHLYKYGYRVNIKFDGAHVVNKTFKTLEEARRARDEALEKYHGEYSWKG